MGNAGVQRVVWKPVGPHPIYEKGEHRPDSQPIGEFVLGPCLGTMPHYSSKPL